MKQWLITKLGGYNNLEEILSSLDKEEKHLILTESIKKLFNTISADDILKEKNGVWRFMDRELLQAEKDLLIAESQTLLTSKLWKILQADVKYQANKQMFILSRNDLDLIMGKSWTFVFDCINTRLKSIQKGFGKYNTG